MNDQGKSSDKYTAVVVGLGKIGIGYDMNLSFNEYVMSHVRALIIHKDYRLVSAVDPDCKMREAFHDQTCLPAFAKIEDMLAEQQPNVVVVACPTAFHFKVLKKIIAHYSPRAILCEKPLALTTKDAQNMVVACKVAGVPLYVNFIRRADPGVKEVRQRIVMGRIAAPLKAVVWYSKGVYHNGSHFIDLMSYWLGPIRAARLIVCERIVGDYDVEADFIMDFKLGSAIFCSVKEENFSHYTVEIIAGNGRLRYERGGNIFWQSVEADNELEAYRRIAETPEMIANDMRRYQFHVYQELSQALRGEKHSLCNGVEAVKAMTIVADLFQECKLVK